MPPSFRSVILDEIDSTNREAFQRAEAGEVGPLWIMARRQTAGRGRSGRQWASEPGNLYASLLVRLACPPAVVPQLSLLAGVAVVDAIGQAAGGAPAGLRLKWPNDVLIGQAKCAGILAESISGHDAVTAVIGTGHQSRLASDRSGPRGHRPGRARRAGIARRPCWAFWRQPCSIGSRCGSCGKGFARVRAAWLERAGPVGESCSVNTGAERIEGTFVGLDPGGALLMQDREGRQRSITFGDVMLATADAGDAS